MKDLPKLKIIDKIINNKVIDKNSINHYYIYLIVQLYLWNKSGYFAVDELIDVLKNNFEKKSLKSKSNIYKFKEKLFEQLKQSNIYFQHINKETFKIISYRKILNSFSTSKYESNYYYFPKAILKSKKLFTDVIIGTFLLNHQGYSNAQVAKHFNITIQRVQQATRRNDKNQVIKKYFRFGMTLCNDKEDARQQRKKLWDLGIRTIIKEKNKKWYICCFRTNYYDGSTIQSHKCRVLTESAEQERVGNIIDKRYCRIANNTIIFKLLGEYGKKFILNLKNNEDSFYTFNEKPKNKFQKNWTLDKYIREYGNFNLCY